MAKLFFRYGTMSASKSTELLITAHNYEQKDMKVLVMKPIIDTRDIGVIKSRLGIERKCDIIFEKYDNLFDKFNLLEDKNNINCILIDEAQFLTELQVVELLHIIIKFNIPIICYGLKIDYMNNGFEGSNALFTLAHDIKELKTVCKCGKKATTHLLKSNGKYVFNGEQIIIGDSEYQSVCYECYFEEKEKTGGA